MRPSRALIDREQCRAAGIAAADLASKEIAERLGLSPRTGQHAPAPQHFPGSGSRPAGRRDALSASRGCRCLI
jgi:hypothetical protein